jgi:hypothetical protein
VLILWKNIWIPVCTGMTGTLGLLPTLLVTVSDCSFFVGVAGSIFAGYFPRDPIPDVPVEEIKVVEEI